MKIESELKYGKDRQNRLIFSQSWEDPILDQRSLNIKPGSRIMCISSGGCNTLNFLISDPEIIYSLDNNCVQSYFLELKIEAIRQLDYKSFCCFWGITQGDDRLLTFHRIKKDLSSSAIEFWDNNQGLIERGLLYAGQFESFIKRATRFLKYLQGDKRLSGLFEQDDLIGQQEFYSKFWDNRRMRLLFRIIFHRRLYPRKALRSDYFEFNDGANSFADSYYKQLKKALHDIPIKGNYFLSMYFRSNYQNLSEVPDYISPQYYEVVRSRLNRIRIISSDVKEWLKSKEDNSLNGFSLSNICELYSVEETGQLFAEIARTGTNKSGVILRNLIVARDIPESLKHIIIKNENLSKELLSTDRSFIYSKVFAYRIKK